MSPATQPSGSALYSYTPRHTLDADEHAACLTNCQQRYDQLSVGAFGGVSKEFCFGKVQLFRQGLNQSVHQAV